MSTEEESVSMDCRSCASRSPSKRIRNRIKESRPGGGATFRASGCGTLTVTDDSDGGGSDPGDGGGSDPGDGGGGGGGVDLPVPPIVLVLALAAAGGFVYLR